MGKEPGADRTRGALWCIAQFVRVRIARGLFSNHSASSFNKLDSVNRTGLSLVLSVVHSASYGGRNGGLPSGEGSTEYS